MEELYGVLEKAHKETGHGGRDRMIKKLHEGYANISRDAIELFLSLCENCNMKKKHAAKGVLVKPILSKEFNSRGQVDLLDFQSSPDGNFRFIMVFQDHLTRFSILKALSSKRAAEVAFHLVDIFSIFGAPHILQSDNGREFIADAISELKLMWTGLIIVHGRPRHPQSQGSVERSNADIHDMITAWMRDNECTRWSIGLKFVQFQKNSSLNTGMTGIGRTPFEAVFGKSASVGFTSDPRIPPEILCTLEKEEDLTKLQLENMPKEQLSDTNGNKDSTDGATLFTDTKQHDKATVFTDTERNDGATVFTDIERNDGATVFTDIERNDGATVFTDIERNDGATVFTDTEHSDEQLSDTNGNKDSTE